MRTGLDQNILDISECGEEGPPLGNMRTYELHFPDASMERCASRVEQSQEKIMIFHSFHDCHCLIISMDGEHMLCIFAHFVADKKRSRCWNDLNFKGIVGRRAEYVVHVERWPVMARPGMLMDCYCVGSCQTIRIDGILNLLRQVKEMKRHISGYPVQGAEHDSLRSSMMLYREKVGSCSFKITGRSTK